jgi:hypothetical protein
MKSVRSQSPLRMRNHIPDPIRALLDSPVGSRVRGLELDLHLREFEINQLTQRNNFFMIFQGVLIAGLVQSQGTAAPVITFAMSFLGTATSLLQMGMAGGAKYWQSRWESATRSSEVAILMELVRANQLGVQTFTLEQTPLAQHEKEEIKRWNDANPHDPIRDDGGEYIRNQVLADIQGSHQRPVRKALDSWVRKFVIAPKWSVSRIPIWIAAFLFLFWATIWLSTWRFTAYPDITGPGWIQLVPLQKQAGAEPASNAVRDEHQVVLRLVEVNAALGSQMSAAISVLKRMEEDLSYQLEPARGARQTKHN